MISVVIPCLDHTRELGECLTALVAQKCSVDVEVIVVDSGHDPAVVEAVDACNSEAITCRVVRGESGLEPGLARNVGVDDARGSTIVFTDADCIPEQGFLEAAVRAMASGHRMATGPVLDANPHWIPACDNLLQFVDFAPTRPAGPAQLAPGANLVIGRDDFLELGGFGPGFGEDTRLCLRAASTEVGAPSFCPDLRIRHCGRTTLRALLAHHRSFGVARGRYGLLVTPLQRRLAAWAVMSVAVALKRYVYLVRRTLRWNPRRLGFVLVFTPVLFAGFFSWALGFRQGLRDG